MRHSCGLTLAAIGAATMLWSSPSLYAVGGSCLPRPLTADEQRAGERVLARLRPLLPPAPSGWQVAGADTTDIASGKCLDATTHQEVAQPVSVQVHRRYTREGPPATPAATPARPVAPAPGPDPEVQARIKLLEQQIDDLKRQQTAATLEYQAARRVGDSDAQRVATAKGRELRLAMEAPTRELMEIRRTERLQRESVNAAQHEAAVAQNKAMLANRRIADVTINTNSGRALSRASTVVSIPGTALAITQPGFSTSLLFGAGWTHANHEAYRPWAPSAPTSRVQDVNVRVEGNDEVRQALIGALDLKALGAIVER